MIKKTIFYAIALLIPLLVVELFFSMLPVSSPPYIMPVNEEHPVARMQSNVEYVYSQGWDFNIRADKKTNNAGYVHEQDYLVDDPRPLMTVIGDSFVEAHHVDTGSTAAELLNRQVADVGRVYSMALSGAPLSQYLKFAEFAKGMYRPQAMTFVIISNDYDQSLSWYSSDPRFHYFHDTANGLVLKRVDYELGAMKSVLRSSAFVRYLMLNLEIKKQLEQLARPAHENGREFVANVHRNVSEQRLLDSKRAVDAFLQQLPGATGLGTGAILFVMDGMRPSLYAPDVLEQDADSFTGQMRRYFSEQAGMYGYEVIDMQPVFIDRHVLDGSRFEFATDNHWNALANKLVAEQVSKSDVYRNIFE